MKQQEPEAFIPQNCAAVILAAGNGTRMGGVAPKALQPIAGYPILHHLLATVENCGFQDIYVIHKPGLLEHFQKVQQQSLAKRVIWVEQQQALGTAHSLAQALPLITQKRTLILLGDTPFVPADTITKISQAHSLLSVVTTNLENPTGMGRIIRTADGNIKNIIEEKDLIGTQKNIKEINTGIIAAQTEIIRQYLPKITNNNQAQEYHLTALIPLVYKNNPNEIHSVHIDDSWRVSGANNRKELIYLERKYLRHLAEAHLSAGVEIKDPERFDCRGLLTCGKNVIIDINVIIEGHVTIGDNCHIGAGCILKNVTIDKGVTIHPYSYIQNTHIGPDASVGPYAYCRDNTHVGKSSQIGCFVETKATKLGSHSKAKHLSYLGNLLIEDNCNIGAGVIHCNYDGKNKHTSIIKSNSFIGADSQIIGPVTIEESVTIAAGTTITKNVPSYSLGISRHQQKNIQGWKKKTKQPVD